MVKRHKQPRHLCQCLDEKEKKYTVKVKALNDYLNETETGIHFYNNYTNNKTFTRKELEDAGFGWVFDCEGIEIEEVE